MGEEDKARDEYARSLLFVRSDADKMELELQSAITWIREDNRRGAEHALREVAKHSHASGLGKLESEAHLMMAQCEPDYKPAMKHLQAAENALNEGHEMSRSNRDEERARILRTRATRSAEAQVMDAAAKALAQLETMAQNSHAQVVQLSYHAAAGAVLVAQQKYAEAIPHLEEDSDNPFTLRLLWQAYSETGAHSEAVAVRDKLTSLNEPTFEHAMVVPPFRASMVGQKQP